MSAGSPHSDQAAPHLQRDGKPMFSHSRWRNIPHSSEEMSYKCSITNCCYQPPKPQETGNLNSTSSLQISSKSPPSSLPKASAGTETREILQSVLNLLCQKGSSQTQHHIYFRNTEILGSCWERSQKHRHKLFAKCVFMLLWHPQRLHNLL